jgi:hypothetical protein
MTGMLMVNSLAPCVDMVNSLAPCVCICLYVCLSLCLYVPLSQALELGAIPIMVREADSDKDFLGRPVFMCLRVYVYV